MTTSSRPARGSESFRARFLERVETLVAHPRVRVDLLHLAPGTAPAVLDAIEAELGSPLPRDVRAFYEEVGRVRLMWRCLPPGSPSDDHRPDMDQAGPDWIADEPKHGIVDIGTADEVFRTGDYRDDLWFPNDVDDELSAIVVDGRDTHRRFLRRFDNIDHYSQVALIVEPGRPVRAVFGGDYFAAVDQHSMRVGRYLDMVVDHLGYQGDAHDGLCAGVEEAIGVTDPYEVSRPLQLDYMD